MSLQFSCLLVLTVTTASTAAAMIISGLRVSPSKPLDVVVAVMIVVIIERIIRIAVGLLVGKDHD
jgi:hypothetical protein